jgi:hypothetical protein
MKEYAILFTENACNEFLPQNGWQIVFLERPCPINSDWEDKNPCILSCKV